jgi:hypothetical protein
MDTSFLPLIAAHEAGHAVCAAALGHKWITAKASHLGGCTRHEGPTVPCEKTARLDAIIAWGGPVAEELLIPRAERAAFEPRRFQGVGTWDPHYSCETDSDTAHLIGLAYHYGGDDPVAWSLWCKARARAILAYHFGALSKCAAALERGQELDWATGALYPVNHNPAFAR